MEAQKKIDGIIDKINLILERNLKLEVELKTLNDRLHTIEKERKLLEVENEGFQKELELVKVLKSAEISDDERSSMKKELKNYIKEIDRCLELLNK
jgi:uncharacterized protein YwgA